MAKFKVIWSTYQIIASVAWTLDISWGEPFATLVRMIEFTQLNMFSLMPIGCVMNWSHYTNLLGATLGALLGLLLGADVRTGAGRGLCGDPAYSAGRPRADVGREGGSISALPRFGVTRVGIETQEATAAAPARTAFGPFDRE